MAIRLRKLSALDLGRHCQLRCARPLMAQSAHFSIALCGISLWTKAASHCFEALRLLVEIINFLVEPCHLGFRRFSAAQLVERLANRKFGCFSHVSPSSLH